MQVDHLLSALKSFPWSLGVALGMLFFFLPHPEWHGDLIAFRDPSYQETLRHPMYFRWIAYLLTWLPHTYAYLLLSLTSILLLYGALKVFGGKHWFVFTSYAFAWVLFYGQVDALVAGGLALAWWAIEKKRPYLVGAGLILASIKPQLSVFLILALWWWSPSRWKSLAIPALVVGLSFIQWSFWIPGWLQNIFTANDLLELPRNISLWSAAGPWIWIIWPLVYALPLPRSRKLAAISAATAMTVPYFPLPSSVLLLVQPIPVLFYIALQIPALVGFVGSFLYDLARLIPPALLLWAAWPVIRNAGQDFYKSHRKGATGNRVGAKIAKKENELSD